MPCIYSLVLLLALLPLSTLTAAERNGGGAVVDDRALTDRFCMRGRRSKTQTPPPKSTEKSLEKISEADVESEKLSEDEEGAEVGMKNIRGVGFEDKVSDDGKMSEQKKEGANQYKPAAASQFKSKGSNHYDLEEMDYTRKF